MKNADETKAAPAAEPTAATVPIAPADPLTFTGDMPEFPAAVVEALRARVDPEWCELRRASEKSDRELLYVPWIHYAQVLINAFGLGGYRMVPRSVPRTEGNTVTWTFALFVRIPGTEKFHFISEAKGECGTHGGMTAGNAAEGAKSDALTKCCKGPLNIFAELFDPNWRRAWEKNAKGERKQEQQRAEWPAARAGAVALSATAPAAAPPAPSSPALESTAHGVKAPAASSTPPASASDTGEAATPEQLEAIKAGIRKLGWKMGYLRMWFAERFATPPTADAPVILGCLTQENAVAALALITAHGQGAIYDKLLAKLQKEGMCR